MYYSKTIFTFCILYFCLGAYAQTGTLKGKVTDWEGNPLEFVNVYTTKAYVFTNASGYYLIRIPAKKPVKISFGFATSKIDTILTLEEEETRLLNIVFSEETLKTVSIESGKDKLKRREISTYQLDARILDRLPSAFGDFNKILSTLPGMVSNNELSSTYSVRGGSFEENLVYVNDIFIYRPFLARSGAQEGLSFIQPALADKVSFSSGGWQSRYGDKLSSVLSVEYRKPSQWGGSVSLGILNNQAHLEGISKNKKFTYLLGARRKSARYLLQTLPVKGEYLPRFFDVQGYFEYEFSKKIRLSLLLSYAQNRYQVEPDTRETTFGTANEVLRFLVAFEGRENLEYDIVQPTLALEYRPNEDLSTKFIFSPMNTREREYTEIEAGYRLCEVSSIPGSSAFNECITTLGLGTQYERLRNRLTATIWAFENRSEYFINQRHTLHFGSRYTIEDIQDVLDESRFTDSVGFISLDERIRADNSTYTHRLAAYVQHNFIINEAHRLSYGLRWNYWNFNKEMWLSPSVQYSYQPPAYKDWIFKAAFGLYRQPPFYRELRNFTGQLNSSLKSQTSIHYIIGADRLFTWWNRPFRLTSELYYKSLKQVVPYDVDNVRLRYYATNEAKAYALGLDMRLSGEFIKGTDSWFSMSLMQTKENVGFDSKGFLRRPTDQRLTFGISLEDHLPNYPTWRMNMQLVWGTGLPFGPPNQPDLRGSFAGPAYRRVDLGFSKFIDHVHLGNTTFLKSLWIGLDILNLLAINNTISFVWIEDVRNRQFAIGNTLSARFLNLRIVGKF